MKGDIPQTSRGLKRKASSGAKLDDFDEVELDSESEVLVRASKKDLSVKLEIYNFRFGNTLFNKEKSAKTILTQFD